MRSRTRAIRIVIERAGCLVVNDPVEHILGLFAEMEKVVLEGNILKEAEVLQASVVEVKKVRPGVKSVILSTFVRAFGMVLNTKTSSPELPVNVSRPRPPDT